jgi:hypothetical protein
LRENQVGILHKEIVKIKAEIGYFAEEPGAWTVGARLKKLRKPHRIW